jgi:hypothetical protein
LRRKLEEAEKQAAGGAQRLRNAEIDNDNFERQLR